MDLLTTPGDGKYGAQYALANSFGFLTNRHSPVLTIGLKPAPLRQELLAFPAFYVLTDGLKLGQRSNLAKHSPCPGKCSHSKYHSAEGVTRLRLVV